MRKHPFRGSGKSLRPVKIEPAKGRYMGAADNPDGRGARGSGNLIPGNWHDNPLTCRILRNAGYALEDRLPSSHAAPAPTPIRTGLGVIRSELHVCNGDKSPDTRNLAAKRRK